MTEQSFYEFKICMYCYNENPYAIIKYIFGYYFHDVNYDLNESCMVIILFFVIVFYLLEIKQRF